MRETDTQSPYLFLSQTLTIPHVCICCMRTYQNIYILDVVKASTATQQNKKKRENGTVCRVESRAPTGRKWPEHICTPSSTNNKEREEGGNPETGSIQPVVKTNPGPFFYTPLSLSDSPFYITVSSIFFFSLLLTFNVNTTIYFVCPTFGSVSFFLNDTGRNSTDHGKKSKQSLLTLHVGYQRPRRGGRGEKISPSPQKPESELESSEPDRLFSLVKCFK